MENESDFFNDTYNILTNYVEDRLLLLRIRAAEKSGKLAAILIKLAVVVIFIFFILLFASLTLGYYLSQVTGSLVSGFGALTVTYLVLFLLFLLINKQFISKWVINTVIRVFFEKTQAEIDADSDYDE
ncbi:MAG: phage holin family protein [Bacteroidia bacterium]|nr:phage holin family protein [Bacteroidia bacterium]